MEKGLYETLTGYCNMDILPMHMPGHKRNPVFEMENPYRIDVTEVTSPIFSLMEVRAVYCRRLPPAAVTGTGLW